MRKIRSLSQEFRMNEQWYGMPPKSRKCYRDNLRALRRRERRELNRLVEQQVVEELTQSAEELRYLWGEYKEWREFAEENSCSFSAETWR